MDEHPLVLEEPFQCSDFLFRALPYDSLIRKDGKHKHQIFMRRAEADADGLSLFTTMQDCRNEFNQPIFGIRSIHVGTLRDYGLDVFRSSLTHATIRQNNGQNVPSKDDDHARAFQIADDLMERSRPIAYWNTEDADERFIRESAEKRAARNAIHPRE